MTKKKDYSKITNIVFGYTPGSIMYCGCLPNDKVYEYLEQLKNTVPVSLKCSYYGFNLRIYPYSNSPQYLRIDANPYVLNPLCKIRSEKGCIRKIKKGTCKNPFIIENIGKIFFADKYKDSKER